MNLLISIDRCATFAEAGLPQRCYCVNDLSGNTCTEFNYASICQYFI